MTDSTASDHESLRARSSPKREQPKACGGVRAGRGRRRSPAGGRAPRRAGVSTPGAAASTPRRWDAARVRAGGVSVCGPAAPPCVCVPRLFAGEPEVDPLRYVYRIRLRSGPDAPTDTVLRTSGASDAHETSTHAPPPPPPTKDNLPHETHTHTHSARVVWSRVTESSSFANKQHAWAHGEHHATRPCSPSVLPRIPPPFDAPPKIDAGLLSSQFSTPVGCVACTGGELWGGDVSV